MGSFLAATPWRVDDSDKDEICIEDATGAPVAHFSFPDNRDRLNAPFIARACNAHDELVGAADDALNVLIGCCIPMGGVSDRKAILDAQMRLRKALRLAGETTPELPSEDA